MTPDMERNHRQDSRDYLSSEDRAAGYSIVADDCNNVTLLRWGKPVARFSAVVTEEVLRGFLKLVKDSERSDNKQAGTK